MISFEALVAKAKQAAADSSAIAEAKAKAKKAKNPKDAAASLAIAHELQSRLDWRTTQLLLRVGAWTCSCGASGHRPEGLYLFQEHTRLANAFRHVRLDSEPVPEVPRRIQSVPEAVDVCPSCAHTQGFSGPFVPPTTLGARHVAHLPTRESWEAADD